MPKDGVDWKAEEEYLESLHHSAGLPGRFPHSQDGEPTKGRRWPIFVRQATHKAVVRFLYLVCLSGMFVAGLAQNWVYAAIGMGALLLYGLLPLMIRPK